MGYNDERYFYLSGAISFTIFALLITLFGLTLLHSSKLQTFAMVQSDTIAVSIAINEQPVHEEMVEPVHNVSEPIPVPEKNEDVEVVKETVPEIGDLFSNVTAVDNTKKKKDEDLKRNESLQNLEKQVLARQHDQQKFTDKVKALQMVQTNVKMVDAGGSTGPLVNEYHAKIQGLVYSQFHPSSGMQGSLSRVKMVISADGKLISYKVLAYSSNSSFNSETDWLKERLKKVFFPPHPEGKEAVLEFILTAKD